MRVVRFRAGQGRARGTDKRNLDELVMLTEAAIAVSNVERWAQEKVARTALERAALLTTGSGAEKEPVSVIPDEVRESAKSRQYETSVVDNFVRLGAQSFASHGTEALWERKVPEGRRGSRKSVDVALFNARRREESRVEFGWYSRDKLAEDAKKLLALPPEKSLTVTNYLILWELESERVKSTSRTWRDECLAAAEAATTEGHVVKLRVASSQDLFVAEPNRARSVNVGMFSVHLVNAPDTEQPGDI